MCAVFHPRRLPALALGALLLAPAGAARAQAPKLATGGQPSMPAEWLDQDTGHRVVRLTPADGSNQSFYFHNRPFLAGKDGDWMVFYHSDAQGKQLRMVNLKTRQVQPLTRYFQKVGGEIVAPKRREVFYQTGDSVYATHVDSRKTRLVFVFPADFRANITTLNADETQLGGAWSSDAEKDISRQYPEKKDYFRRIYEAKLPRTLFTVSAEGGQLTKLFTDTAWLNHVQFSPTDPRLLMFCHEGPWELVDRIWTIDTKTKQVKLVHKRTMDREIAGHEWFGADGKTIWFDHQLPRGATFFVTGTDLKSGKERKYELTRDEWSVHYTTAPDQKTFAGDGGYPTSVAHSPNGQWIYLFRPDGDRFKSEKLVNLAKHNYHLEPNVHYSPDGKWLIFRANFEGESQVYAVEINKTAS
ncbi:oligogalacturonate lyase family protein [Hymenobacter sp. 15J16-1T3B]|uniref:oligogalacturonate lyase family protein n=1 Tax=Hymenobacter sp. 15J16-1T3B TaxID=2886941 RepID=UPI001D11D903|nr:oligogalacturonate lyase family protein [Hymenobacter sp. 15J16-1T3B]MCC3160556.1 oligogalacturonate lyase family protein [Hymenobacter sp. 15J16-1T3B]